MGCWYPLREIVSKALGKCNGHERWREEDQRMDYAMAYPPAQTHYMRPVARTVTFSGTNSVHMIPPNPQQGPPPHQQQAPAEPQQSQAPPPPQNEPNHQQQHQPEQPQPTPEQGAPPQGEQPRQPRRSKKKPPRRVRFGPDQQPPPPQQQQQPEMQQQQQQQPEHAPGHHGHGGPHHGGSAPGGHHQQQGHGPHGPPGYFRYTPSPLPRWEATPRRHEYFSGEYRHSYPTPVREGIYSLATDANRLTTIFSEENPNACAIV